MIRAYRVELLVVALFLFLMLGSSAGDPSNEYADVPVTSGNQTFRGFRSEGAETSTWHHDCSNMTAFDGMGDSSWPHDPAVGVSFGSMSSSGAYVYPTDVGSGSVHHGPLYFHTLSSPFQIDQFLSLEIEVELDAISADRGGWMIVGLHDSTNKTIIMLQTADPWVGVNEVKGVSLYKFSNGTSVQTPGSYPDYSEPAPYHATVKLVRNSNGLYTELPGMTNSCLIEASYIESNRMVAFVSIHLMGYGTWALCETMRIHDIRLTWNSSPEVWHHDCSSMTAFDGIGDSSWPANPEIEVSFGSMSSSGAYIYPTDVGSGSAHHGPLYYHTLSSPFLLDQFLSLEVEAEIDAISADRGGWMIVSLHDPTNKTIINLQVIDPWTGINEAKANSKYKFSNDTVVETPGSWPDYSEPAPYHATVRLVRNSTGLYTELPGMTNSCLIEASYIESNRMVAHISIHLMGYDSWALCETMKIHDIRLIWNSTSTTSASTPTPTMPLGNLALVIIIVGVGGAVIIILTVYVLKKKW